MKKRWLLAGIASCALLTACFPARMTEQPGFLLEVRDRNTGAVLTNAHVYWVKVRRDIRPEIVMREFRTDVDGLVRFDRATDWQLIVAAPEQNYSWEWYLCVDKEGYLPFANNVVEAKPPGHVLVELKRAKGKERCSWHSTDPFGFNLPGLTAFAQ
jgi:hypothetical protein